MKTDIIEFKNDQHMDSRIVIVAYKPKPGKGGDLEKLVLTHYERLDRESLVTGRKPVIMKTGDGIIIEVFEWKSAAAIEKAHSNQAVQQMWGEFGAVCDYIPFGSVSESSNMFANFSPVN